MTESPASERAKDRFNAALDARRHEIDLFWKRSLFFWGFIAASFIALSSAYGEHEHLAFAITTFGLVCSFSWTLANRASRRWHVHWEKVVQEEQKEPIGELFAMPAKRDEDGRWLVARPYSVGKLTIALSDYVFALWFALFLYQAVPLVVRIVPGWDFRHVAVIAWGIFTLVYAGFILCKARSKHPDETEGDG